ncbi:hypothetical protein [Jiangella rhizosphaerae]|uniref:Lipoprotein n=1 Tax=Jiangella rhizosphaerae TaxID=2293569 RepID=A0A418KI79_9ACTN|nr:hypothetical protein [Jiangella rhizosphaerae]RIQ12667.1 hypothetical protein DY240_26875 [Jiangella rhizosphaerae]
MRARTALTCALAAVVAAAACGGPSDDSSAGGSEESGVVRVLIPDGNLRRLGEPCNGAGAFRSIHAEAAFTVEDGDGVEVARGELPSGSAEKMMDVSFREGMRQPTMCVMEVDVEGLTSIDGRTFVVGDGFEAPIEPSEDAGLIGEVLIS